MSRRIGARTGPSRTHARRFPAVMIWIWVRWDEAEGAAGESAKVRLCTVCGDLAPYLAYDGLDPNEQRHPHTGRPFSADVAHC